MGDPAGCGPQITALAWQARNDHKLRPFFVIGDPDVYQPFVPVERITAPESAVTIFERALPVLPLKLSASAQLSPGTPSGDYASAIIESIRMSATLALRGQASAVVTNPISKAVLYHEGFAFPGHTEFIADLCNSARQSDVKPIMMLVGGGLRVALATIHVPLMRVLDHLSAEMLAETAKITHRALVEDFGFNAPRLVFTGLNPHAGEDGTIGTEERDLINPVAAQLRKDGIDISDARPADTVFHESLDGRFDAVIAMTHDQGLIPVKTLDMWGGVNTTLGLPIIRTSPDHGTAYEAAAAGTCRPDSLIAALKLANQLVENRAIAYD